MRQVGYLQRNCGSWIFIVNPKSSCRYLWFNCTTTVQCGRSATLWHFIVLWPSFSKTAVVKLAYCCPYITYFAKDRNCNTDWFTGTSRCRDCIRHREVSSQRGGPGSIPGQSTWHVWWTECYCDRSSHPSVTVLLLRNHLHLIFALTRRTNGRLGTSKSNVVPEIGATWLGQYFCLVCTGFKINSTRGGVYCSELSIVQTCLLLRAFYCWDLFRPVYCAHLSIVQTSLCLRTIFQTSLLLRPVIC